MISTNFDLKLIITITAVSDSNNLLKTYTRFNRLDIITLFLQNKLLLLYNYMCIYKEQRKLII